MLTFWQDIRYGARMLVRQLGFTVIAVITLALGIGANTAIFSVVHGVLLRPLPFRDSERLVLVWNKGAEAAGGDRTPLAVADLLDWREQNHTFESVAAFQPGLFNYRGEVPEQVRGLGVTSNFLTVLGVGVRLGRAFESSDEQVGAPRVVLISDRFWSTRFNSDPQVVGRTINLSGVSTTIVGVMPGSFSFPSRETDLWRAMQLEPPTRRGPYFLSGLGRLKADVTIDQARADTRGIEPRFHNGENFNFNVQAINDFLVGDVSAALIALLIAVTLVLLIAAVNVANLSLVHAASRFKEISIRVALGASRARIVKRLLTESLLLAIAGGALGTLLALWGVSLLLKFAPANLPRMEEIRIDPWVLGWTAFITILTGIVFGLAPALQGSRLNLNEALRDGARTTDGAGGRRSRNALIVIELALAVMLLSGAGLLLKSLWRLQNVDLGINPDRVLTMQVALRGQRYEDPAQVKDFSERLIQQTKSIPGVRLVALTNSLPPDETEFSSDFNIEGRSAPTNAEPQIAYFTRVSPDYFQALGIPVRSGRAFSGADSDAAPRVTLINDTLRRRFFPNEDPVGRRINFGREGEPDWHQIVGVVGDVKYNGLAEDIQPAIYQPVAQQASWGISLILKTDIADPLSLTPAIRGELRKIDPDLPLTQVSTMDQRISVAMAQPRFRTSLIALFAAVALLLACVGIYGVVSYSVSQRTHEIGIRMALGAQQGDMLRMVIKQTLVFAAAGVTLGLSASLALTGFMSTLLFGVAPNDPPTFVLTAAVLALTALLAAYLPARRAAKVDPLVALRYE
ncbi:MAG TPA: ABC transporter permease [Pyrinomonadaceae bacterium]|nr:ABC transporter permease [Pyrinomonadaceae bacterium]